MFKGFEVEPYQPGRQKTPLLAATFGVAMLYWAVYSWEAHVKTHAINVTHPPRSPILDDYFFFDDSTLHKVVHQYHPQLMREYVWLLVLRWFYGLVYGFWGVEVLMRTHRVVHSDRSPLRRLPLELLPFLIALLEVVANTIVIFILVNHPWHWHWLVDLAGYLTLVKHSTIYFCYGLVVLALVVGFKRGHFEDQKLE